MTKDWIDDLYVYTIPNLAAIVAHDDFGSFVSFPFSLHLGHSEGYVIEQAHLYIEALEQGYSGTWSDGSPIL